MYIYIYNIYIYIHIYIHTHIYIYIYIYTHTYTTHSTSQFSMTILSKCVWLVRIWGHLPNPIICLCIYNMCMCVCNFILCDYIYIYYKLYDTIRKYTWSGKTSQQDNRHETWSRLRLPLSSIFMSRWLLLLQRQRKWHYRRNNSH